MIGGETVVAVVPARGESKSIPRKNLRSLGGRPLIAWPIETARATPAIDRIVVSTDDREIAEVACSLGAEVYERPPHLAGDTALVIDALRHLRDVLAAEGAPAGIMVLLEATSPFRTPAMITACLERLMAENLDSIATFNQVAIHPERTWRIEDGQPRPFIPGAVPWRPRQELVPAYQLNGAVYAFRVARLPNEGPGLLFGAMGAELVAAGKVIDIDDEKDFKIAHAVLGSR